MELYKTKIDKVDIIIYFGWFVFFSVFLSKLNYKNADLKVIISFFLIGIASFFLAIKNQRNVSIKRNIYIFYLVFFFFAPLQQYLEKTRIWSGNGMSFVFKNEDYFKVNILLLFFMILFEIGYNIKIKRRNIFSEVEEKKIILSDKTIIYVERKQRISLLLLMITLITDIVIGVTKGMDNISNNSALMSQIKHMVIFSPIVCIIICLINAKEGNEYAKRYLGIMLGSTGIVFAVISEIMSRFIMLGAIMAIVSYAFYNFKYKSFYFSLYTFGFFFAFSILRHNNLLDGNVLSFVDFTHMDYDAYQIFMMVVRYVEKNGISWGMNLLSAFFCLIPRSVASFRLESTGGIVMIFSGSWFTNVSCPLPAEFYFAFGTLGLLVFSFLLGRFVFWLDKKCEEDSHFYKGLFSIISGVSIYLMRGSLLPTFSFTIGIVIVYWVIYHCIYMKVRSS